MKVIQVMPEFGLAGAETMCENLSVELVKMGVDVVVISLYDFNSAITRRLEDYGIKVRYLGKKKGLDISVINRLRNIFEEEHPDVVHTHRYVMKYVYPAACIARVPKIIHTVHNVAEKENSETGKLLNRFFFKSKKIIPVALSGHVQDTIISFYKLKKDCVPVVYNGIQISKCIPKNSYELKKPISIIHVGRMSDQKNHVELLKSMKILIDKGYHIELTMIGDGELRKEISNDICMHNLQDNIRWIKETDNIYPFLHDADIFVLPSKYEGVPMSLIEAMGTALPVVVSNVGGIPDMIQDGESGVFCDPSSGSISKALETMIQNIELREKCGKNAKKSVVKFSVEVMAKAYYELYEGKVPLETE